jgi:hypothetical protein
MEMRWSVIVPIHIDRDAQESGDLRHMASAVEVHPNTLVRVASGIILLPPGGPKSPSRVA